MIDYVEIRLDLMSGESFHEGANEWKARRVSTHLLEGGEIDVLLSF